MNAATQPDVDPATGAPPAERQPPADEAENRTGLRGLLARAAAGVQAAHSGGVPF